MESIWSKTTTFRQRPALPGDLKTEAVVIGGGMAGILTALFLTERNVKTVVLEAGRIGSGQTKNTTAKITSQHGLIYSKLEKDFGVEKARQYAQANEGAIGGYRAIIEKRRIDCSFEERSAYLYSRSLEDLSALEHETEAAIRMGLPAQLVTETGLPVPVAGAVKFYGQAQFHPLAFLAAIAEEVEVYEQTRVLTVEDTRVMTEHGCVTAEHIVFACHFPFVNSPGYYFTRMHQERSYVLALKGAVVPDGMYLGVDEDALSIRSFENMVLLGGGGHRTGENSAGGRYAFLRDRAARWYPGSTELLRWSAQDCMTLDGLPYIGPFSSSSPHWYVATGFGKWGMTSSMAAAQILASQITGNEHPCAEVFSPQRFTPAPSAKAFLADMGQAVKGITKQIFSLPEAELEDLSAGRGGVVEHEGEKVGVYRDEHGTVFAVSTRCPHLGCQLEWNPDEKSWDCPCHGSRFDYRGVLLDNPAQTSLASFPHQ